MRKSGHKSTQVVSGPLEKYLVDKIEQQQVDVLLQQFYIAFRMCLVKTINVAISIAEGQKFVECFNVFFEQYIHYLDLMQYHVDTNVGVIPAMEFIGPRLQSFLTYVAGQGYVKDIASKERYYTQQETLYQESAAKYEGLRQSLIDRLLTSSPKYTQKRLFAAKPDKGYMLCKIDEAYQSGSIVQLMRKVLDYLGINETAKKAIARLDTYDHVITYLKKQEAKNYTTLHGQAIAAYSTGSKVQPSYLTNVNDLMATRVPDNVFDGINFPKQLDEVLNKVIRKVIGRPRQVEMDVSIFVPQKQEVLSFAPSIKSMDRDNGLLKRFSLGECMLEMFEAYLTNSDRKAAHHSDLIAKKVFLAIRSIFSSLYDFDTITVNKHFLYIFQERFMGLLAETETKLVKDRSVVGFVNVSVAHLVGQIFNGVMEQLIPALKIEPIQQMQLMGTLKERYQAQIMKELKAENLAKPISERRSEQELEEDKRFDVESLLLESEQTVFGVGAVHRAYINEEELSDAQIRALDALVNCVAKVIEKNQHEIAQIKQVALMYGGNELQLAKELYRILGGTQSNVKNAKCMTDLTALLQKNQNEDAKKFLLIIIFAEDCRVYNELAYKDRIAFGTVSIEVTKIVRDRFGALSSTSEAKKLINEHLEQKKKYLNKVYDAVNDVVKKMIDIACVEETIDVGVVAGRKPIELLKQYLKAMPDETAVFKKLMTGKDSIPPKKVDVEQLEQRYNDLRLIMPHFFKVIEAILGKIVDIKVNLQEQLLWLRQPQVNSLNVLYTVSLLLRQIAILKEYISVCHQCCTGFIDKVGDIVKTDIDGWYRGFVAIAKALDKLFDSVSAKFKHIERSLYKVDPEVAFVMLLEASKTISSDMESFKLTSDHLDRNLPPVLAKEYVAKVNPIWSKLQAAYNNLVWAGKYQPFYDHPKYRGGMPELISAGYGQNDGSKGKVRQDSMGVCLANAGLMGHSGASHKRSKSAPGALHSVVLSM